MRSKQLFLLFPILLTWTNWECQSLKILSISFFAIPSHKVLYDPLLQKLAERGHEVTVVSPIKQKKEIKNMRYFHTLDIEQLQKEMGSINMFEMKEVLAIVEKVVSPFFFFGWMLEPICRQSYALPIVQDIISGKEKFDLIIYSSFFNDCLHGLVHYLNVPVVYLSQVTVLPWVAGSLGTPTPASFVPMPLLGYTDKMSYTERLANFVGMCFNDVVKSLLFNPKMERIYRELVDPNLPGIKEIEANASIILANSHVSFTPPRPLMPDIIDIGGFHLKPSKPVQPQDLQDFLNGSGENGFILFSMGSALKGAMMPERYRQVFLKTFSKLKQRVIWKWETEQMEDLPSNVRLSKWLPQSDVLGHKNIRLFITHGGHGGTTEAIYHGVPVVGIPILGDQPYNMQLAEKKGFGISLELTQLSEQVLMDAIQKVLNDPSYRNTIKKLSSIYRDQPDNPLDRAVYYVEYVHRHQGARHLRSAARDLSIVQYYSLDVIATLLGFLVLKLYIDFLVLRAIYRRCCKAKRPQGPAGRTKKVQ